MFVRFFQAALMGAVMAWSVMTPNATSAAPYAAMVMDARNGEVLHSRNADTRLHPASLTKMMTLYIAFEAVRLGEIGLDTEVTISRNAAAEPPSKLGLRAGSSIRFRFLIRAAAIRSANDAATAIGEALSGSEAAFARRMNRTAAALGMTRTNFHNAHGLTQAGHLSTARDMTTLGRRLIYDYPQYYNIFSRVTDNAGIARIRNTNRVVLTSYRGADGIKTGYTRAAGFNLVASAQRGQERIIATVFGGQSGAWRNQRIMELLDMGFQRAPSRVAVRTPPLPDYSNFPALVGSGGAPPGRRDVTSSPRPMMRPSQGMDPSVLAAIDQAVGEALLADPNNGLVVDPEVSAAVEAAIGAVQSAPQRGEPQASLGLAPALVPIAPQVAPEVITRSSSTGSRTYGVSLGPQVSRHAAERLLLQTALAELGTFDTAIRRVVRVSRGHDARFMGMTSDQAERACARLHARRASCEMVYP